MLVGLAAGAPKADFESRLRALRSLGAAPYGVIGDSHSRLLLRRDVRRGRWLAPIGALETGASARGLANVDGRSGAGARVQAALSRMLAVEDLPILLKFGQVDVEFVHTFKRLASGVGAFDEAGFDAFLDETAERYVGFLAKATPVADRARVRVMSLFPPTLSDASWRTGYLNGHIVELHGPAESADLAQSLARLEIPSQIHRTALHARASARLREAARAKGFAVEDDHTALLGPAGVVDEALLGHTAGRDHHLDFHASRAPMLDRIWSLIA